MSEYTADLAEMLLTAAEPEPHIVVAADRSVLVPDDLKEIATQFDHNIETVTFDCPRYWDGHDFSKMHVFVNYRCADGKIDSYPCDPPTVDAEDETTIHFDWTLSRNVTCAKGVISFLVCVKSSDRNGVLQNQWSSRLNQEMEVLEGIECNTEEIIPDDPDVIERILNRLDELERNGGGGSGSGSGSGADGFSPFAYVEQTDDGAVITITDKTGTTTATVYNGMDGYTPIKGVDYFDGTNGIDGYTPVKGVDYFDGEPGRNGTSVTVASVSPSSVDGGSNVVRFSDGKTVTIKNGSKGSDGKDGVSPVIGVSKVGKVTTITITDAQGTKTATIRDGEDGVGGDSSSGGTGAAGKDGIGIASIVQTQKSTEDDGINIITVTLTDGSQHTFEVQNGSKGSTGKDGEKGNDGAPGYTPVKGTDYFTESDKAELVSAVLAALPVAEGVDF